MAAIGEAEQLSYRSIDIARLVQEFDGRLIDPAEYTYLIRSEDPGLRVALAEGARLASGEVQSKLLRPQLCKMMAMGRLIKTGRGNLKTQIQAPQ